MSLDPHTRLGPYEILAPLGAGGMGEVYRARDSRLKREVAIKILPESFASDPERLARFQREAEVLASLNHPNIAGIHGLEESGGIRALVMELVEGETLADRIARGAIPLDEALPIARQIAEALEAAHERGIIHRDLKPANIKVTPAGVVKVLDFGLAKLSQANVGRDFSPAGSKDPAYMASQSPTITSPAMMTGAGMILGTAAYMSPEQAKGREADRRSDVWAFGCVLYEMLTGRRAFAGDDVAETMAAVIRAEPEWAALPASVPSRLVTLLRRALIKDVHARLPHMAIARYELDAASEQPPPVSAMRRPWLNAAIAAAVAVVGVSAALAFWLRPLPPRQQLINAALPLPEGVELSTGARDFALSPDGARAAFIGIERGRSRLWVRALAAPDAEPLPGTEGASTPFWSPDSRWIAFFAAGRLKKISVEGGQPLAVADIGSMVSGSWSSSDDIIVSGFRPAGAPIGLSFTALVGLYRVPAAGGTFERLALELPADAGEPHHPSYLPDGAHYLFTAGGHIWVAGGSLAAPRRLRPGLNAEYAANHLLFTQDNALLAQAFDVRALEVRGDPTRLVDEIRLAGQQTQLANVFSSSSAGTVGYVRGATAGIVRRLTWYRRDGTPGDVIGEPSTAVPLNDPALSPDNRWAVFLKPQSPTDPRRDLWLLDIARNVTTRFTSDEGDDAFPRWSPDSGHVVWTSVGRGGELYRKSVTGGQNEEPIAVSNMGVVPGAKAPYDWSPDGRHILIRTATGDSGQDIWTLSLESGVAVPFANGRFDETDARFSPDGRWVVFTWNEAGRTDVYVRPFGRDGAAWRVSNGDGGGSPRWSVDGAEIFYLAPGGSLMAARVTSTGEQFETGPPVPLFQTPLPGPANHAFWPSRDGRFLVNVPANQPTSAGFTLLVNWPALLEPRP